MSTSDESPLAVIPVCLANVVAIEPDTVERNL